METPNLRRTLAIVFCDIAGTTRLMAQKGDLVASTVLRDFFEHAGRLGKEYNCELIKFIGDGFLAAFERIGDVLPFVRSIENLLTIVPAMEGLDFRFSVHFGEALCIETSYGRDIFGDDINTVARLNSLAEPGQIVISEAALTQMPAEQQALVGPSETGRLGRGGEVQIHRIRLAAA